MQLKPQMDAPTINNATTRHMAGQLESQEKREVFLCTKWKSVAPFTQSTARGPANGLRVVGIGPIVGLGAPEASEWWLVGFISA